YPVWVSLARDYLLIIASSVSSEHAFSAAGITISKRHNQLGADVIEALQFLKCWFQHDLIFREAPSLELEGSFIDENRDKEKGDEEGSWADEMLEDADVDDMDVEPDG